MQGQRQPRGRGAVVVDFKLEVVVIPVADVGRAAPPRPVTT